jgi:predicted dehydrogenase
MKIAFVGCGYVFDIYMRTRWAYPELEVAGVYDIDTKRSAVVARHYGFHVYPSYDDLLADPEVEIVVNLTNIGSHADTIRRALEAGKHVYSEKPLTTDVTETRMLFELADEMGVVFSGAPCNLYSDAAVTVWTAVRDGAIGKPVLVYAEIDDNPAHLMSLETKSSPTGAPFPVREELQEGCTVEHVAYHLVWLCAMFGPVVSLTAFSNCLIEHKTDVPLDPDDTPDLSVACLQFASGTAARVTCSWVAPRDHSYRIIGEEGQISADNAFHDQSPIFLERFSGVGLSARKSNTLRTQPLLGRYFGIGGRRIRLVRRWRSHAVEEERGVGRSPKHKLVSWLRSRESYAKDKLLGVGEMVRAMEEGRPQPMSPDFMLHLNELTFLIQEAGPSGIAMKPTTTFESFDWVPDTIEEPGDYLAGYRPRFTEKILGRLVHAMNRR